MYTVYRVYLQNQLLGFHVFLPNLHRVVRKLSSNLPQPVIDLECERNSVVHRRCHELVRPSSCAAASPWCVEVFSSMAPDPGKTSQKICRIKKKE